MHPVTAAVTARIVERLNRYPLQAVTLWKFTASRGRAGAL